MLGMFCLCKRPVTAHGCSRCPLWRPCAATGRWHYSIVRTMTPWNHALRVSFVCSKAWVVLPLLLFCWYCCNSDGRFATLFEICGYDCCGSSIEICLARQRIYLVLRRGCWGRANHLDPGCSSVAFWQQRAVSPLWLGFASADVGWVIWIEVVITLSCHRA